MPENIYNDIARDIGRLSSGDSKAIATVVAKHTANYLTGASIGKVAKSGVSKNLTKNISNKILKNGKVNLSMFKNGKSGKWRIEVDTGKHASSYKLKNKTMKKVWSITEDGKVLRVRPGK